MVGEPNQNSDPTFDPSQADWTVRALIDHPQVTWLADSESDALIAGIRDELLVHPSASDAARREVARICGGGGPLRRLSDSGVECPSSQNVEIWRIQEEHLLPSEDNTNLDSFDWAAKLNEDAEEITIEGKPFLPVSPNHVAVVA